ncbi:ATP-dependent helicase HrpB [Cyanobium sp. FGCU-52]|nr:ATP-dependent helicase HrpB [Cyanobium sp. FGCU52]
MTVPPLPIDDQLEAIATALVPGATLLLQAPPGAGKTTRVPLALLEAIGSEGSILMIEPRRLSARGAATRLARGLGERVGERVGYSVRLESRTSASTRVEVVTGGIFLRRLQADPALEGVACVIFDEFHERGAEADLGLALVRQARSLLRPDLRVLVMSATLDLEPLAGSLDGAAVITSEGRSHPVAVSHQPPRPDESLPRQVVRALESHWLEADGPPSTVALVFLPGQREIRATQRAIAERDWAAGLPVCPLHGQLPLTAQVEAIGPGQGGGARVVLATSIAESSLTIEGVELVVDSGLSRRSRFDPGTGMDGLVTLPASLASAEQRRGRAGRLGPGRCVRLWSPAESQRRPAFDPPELLEVDPVPMALQLAAWGAPAGEGLPWITPPPRATLQEALEVLRRLGALEEGGNVSRHGRALAGLGLHPRLGHMLLQASPRGWLPIAAGLAVLLSERDPLDRQEAGSDLMARLDWLRASDRRDEHRRRPLQLLQAQLLRQVRAALRDAALGDTAAGTPAPAEPGPEDTIAARLLAWAFPERIALSRGQGDGRFLLRSGRGARLHPTDPLAGAAALAVATVDGEGSEARILLATALPDAVREELAAAEARIHCEARWDEASERVRCERLLRLDALVLERTPWPDAEPEAVRAALGEGLRLMGLEALPWTPRSRQLQRRLALAHRHLGAPWPDRSLETLTADPEVWLGPQLDGLLSRQDLQRLDLVEALWQGVPWDQRQRLDAWLPEELPIPSGRRARIEYGEEEGVLAVKLQELFGCPALPPLLEGRVPLTVHLLTPAGRPAAITRDLAGFWTTGYAEVRRELRGRYPRHPWPEDPRTAVATALTQAGLRRSAGGQQP